MSVVEVVRVKVDRAELTPDASLVLRELFHITRLPLAESRVEIELKGVPTAVVNALRRVVTDEMPGRSLQVPADGFVTEETTDLFMLPQFVVGRINQIPLRPQIPADIVNNLRLSLDVTNRGASTLAVYTGDFEITAGTMPEPLFNPTFKVAILQPGKRLVVRDIRIMSGYGRDNGAYIVARRAAYEHLDIPQYPNDETHKSTGSKVDESGYKQSCLVANPRHHRLTATLPATSANSAETLAVFADACGNIQDRLRLIATAIERRGDSAAGGFAHRGVQYTVVQLEGGLVEGILQVPGETYTIGELLRRVVYELTPDIANVKYLIVSHENRLNFTIRHTEDVTRILTSAIQHAITIFGTIQRGISASRDH